MKKHLLLLTVIIFSTVSVSLSQTFSRNNYTGMWNSTSSWIGGIAPPVTAIASDLTIQGYITRDGNLDFASNNADKSIIINDTLVVLGDMIFANSAQDLVINSGAVLIVMGNFTATNKIDLSNGGIFVVRGNVSLSNSGQDQYAGSGELFVLGTISGSPAATTANDNSGSLSDNYPNIYNFVVGNTTSLPVKLLNFSGKRINGNILLSWSTSNEKNFDFFTVERSSDYKNFKEIGIIKGAGNTTAILNYQYTDNTPLLGDTYYRLKATDFDGTHEYHQVLKITSSKDGKLMLAIYPNPLAGQNFKIHSSFDTGSLKIYNILGKMVFHSQLVSGEFHLEKKLDPGLYIVIAENGNQKLQTKLNVK